MVGLGATDHGRGHEGKTNKTEHDGWGLGEKDDGERMLEGVVYCGARDALPTVVLSHSGSSRSIPILERKESQTQSALGHHVRGIFPLLGISCSC